MRNGFFQLINMGNGYGIKVVPPQDGGEAVSIGEMAEYLNARAVPYELKELKTVLEIDPQAKEKTLRLGDGECPRANESYKLTVSEDNMSASARFYPASDTGSEMSLEEFIRDMRIRNITYGFQMGNLQGHFQTREDYCTDMLVAEGKEPCHGTDARIEYFFNTDVHIRPTVNDDGSVDFFNLNTINHCHQGDVLAKIVPEDVGEPGRTIQGNTIRPREVKRTVLRYGNNIELSEDRLSISSKVDGHVLLVEGKVFVSDVYEVENVDNSTGNIEFQGSVQVNGNVQSNFSVKAKGNVIINGVVEGAHIEAGGDIIIARGMNGMGKGSLKAGGNIIAKFLESLSASAEGYVSSGSILHSRVMAGTTVEVDGKRGFITGGQVTAGDKVTVKTLGSEMGASTVIEVGISPEIKLRYQELQKEIAEIVKIIRSSQPIIANFTEKKAKGARITEDQVKYIKSVARLMELKKNELQNKNEEMSELQLKMEQQNKASVVVKDTVYSGATIVIGDVSMVVQNSYKFCRFEKIRGDVKMVPL